MDAVSRLSQAAGWNQTRADWETLLDIEPEGCFGIADDGGIVASTTTVCYGVDLAWIGMVLTDPAYRGRGFARALMNESLAFCERRGVEWIMLDATDMGRPLYLSLGFEDRAAVERWVRPPGPYDGPAAADGAIDVELDRVAFGTDRAALVARLGRDGCAAVSGVGYTAGRPGYSASYFGPCVSRDAEAVGALVGWFLLRNELDYVIWDLFAANTAAVDLAGQLGFERRRRLTRMARRGCGRLMPAGDESKIYALAGFEFG